MKTNLTREEIIKRIKAHPKPLIRLTREQLIKRFQELAITNPPKKPKNAVWG
jgi:hypothetical protein